MTGKTEAALETRVETAVQRLIRQVAEGNAPEEFTFDGGLRIVRRDLADVPPRTHERVNRTPEQIAQDERHVISAGGVEYISDPDLAQAVEIYETEQARAIGEIVEEPDRATGDSTGATLGVSDEEHTERFFYGGGDSRNLHSSDSTTFPYSTQVVITGNGAGGSGTMVGTYLLATAAHTIHNGSSFYTPYPRFRSGNGSAGNWWDITNTTSSSACYLMAVKNAWDGSVNDTLYDFAAVDFSGCSAAGLGSQGHLGMGTAIYSNMRYLYGYPSPPPSGSSNRIWGEGVQDGGYYGSYYSTSWYHFIDESDGQSGAGIYWKDGNDVRRVGAIHKGAWDFPLDQSNHARDIDGFVFDFFVSYGLQ